MLLAISMAGYGSPWSGFAPNHRKVPETGGFQPVSGVSPDTKYPPGGWEGKQTLAFKGLLVQSPIERTRFSVFQLS